jgi:RNA polymerase sigma-70 factor (ECF subfamily)
MTQNKDSSTTSLTLLDMARSNDPDAWRQMCDIYSPLVYSWVKRGGLQDSDAADVVQDVFRIVIKNLNRFQHRREGDSFRGWLWPVTRNEVRGWHRRASKNPELAFGGTDAAQQIAAIPDWVEDYSGLNEIQADEQAESQMVQLAAQAIKNDFAEHTWQAFWRSTVDGESAIDIAADLNMTAGGVRQAKFRVLARLREFLE